VGLPGEIWRSADLLSEDEWRDMRRHPEIGYRIALACDHLAPVAEAILGHHERHDGTGYPRGLKEDEILPINRLFAVVDAYNAMISPRPGRPARSSLEAAEELRRHSGSQFDPEAVAFFLEAFPELEDA
jgi:HD-GYP domain-containing protein (c-di-GMP phosphodiesterase class II)